MSDEKKVLLLVDCQILWHEQLRKALKDHPFEILSAYDATGARWLFANYPHIDVVIVDDHISAELDTLELVVEIKRGFQGYMIACCSNCNNGDILVRAGCDQYVCKSHLGELLLKHFSSEPVLT